MEKYLNRLNEQQKKAVLHGQGPCMVYAGPGSGKTTVITYRIKHLIKACRVNPNHILVITFTKAAAEEMKQRFYCLVKDEIPGAGRVHFGTFHSVFFRIIRSHWGYGLGQILDEGEKYTVIKNIAKTLMIDYADDDELIKELLLEMALYYSNYTGRQNFTSQCILTKDFLRLIDCYENYKNDHQKIDFDDMLIKCYRLLNENPKVLKLLRNQFQYILIDEFQDINQIQFEIIKLLSAPQYNLFVVGDDDQSIYSFRGGRPDFILDFEKYFPNSNKIVIDVNYRSQGNLIKGANALITNNKVRIPKNIVAYHSPKEEIRYMIPKSREEENRLVSSLIKDWHRSGVSYGDMAIIYRTNMLGAAMVGELLENQIPFYCKDQIYNIYEHWAARDILTYLSLGQNPMDSRGMASIINRPTRYISKKAMEAALNYHKDFITALKVKGELKSYQTKHLDQLQLDLKNIGNLSTHQAIGYIRRQVGYDQYIENYCVEKKISSNGIFEILDEVEESSAKFSEQGAFLQYISNFKAQIKQHKNKIKNQDEVNLLTMHGAKGLEFKIVFIIGAIEGIVPHNKVLETEEAIEEERRLFYVAITRAKENLYVSSPQFRYDKRAETSRFVDEMKQLTPVKDGLTIGKAIYHRLFGKGLIEGITDKIVKIRFLNSNQIKDFDLQTCIRNRILQQ